ncbi:TerD family protein [Streptomyces sp. SCL15-6]|uniref:TerD family protein n=1 Tax=Streptomyces sp. SCL15-6 TaxID=2967222 RepID=UPI002966F15C|nr:TerD family protein [Streptomyces sp. SCL15-6]
MPHITKGANAPVPTVPLRVAVGRSRIPGVPAVEAAALLLDGTGSVRGDTDIVFHDQPAHPSGTVRHLGTGEGGGQLAEWLELDLPRIEPAVQRVLIAGSCDDGVFGQVPGLYAQMVAHYAVTAASSETAFVRSTRAAPASSWSAARSPRSGGWSPPPSPTRPCWARGPSAPRMESYVTPGPTPRCPSSPRAASSTSTSSTKICSRGGKSPQLPVRTTSRKEFSTCGRSATG